MNLTAPYPFVINFGINKGDKQFAPRQKKTPPLFPSSFSRLSGWVPSRLPV